MLSFTGISIAQRQQWGSHTVEGAHSVVLVRKTGTRSSKSTSTKAVIRLSSSE